MSNNLINLQDFTTMLKSYRKTLEEMNKLTEAEIQRVSSIGITLNENEGMSANEATIFINKQMYSYLEELTLMTNSIPEYTAYGCLSPEEMHILQQKALLKLKELGCDNLARN